MKIDKMVLIIVIADW